MYGPGSYDEENGGGGDYDPPPRKSKTKADKAKEREDYLLERKTQGVAVLKTLKKDLEYEDPDEISYEDTVEVLLYLYEEVKSLRKRIALLEGKNSPSISKAIKYKK